jgi:high affinity sulfate transporter 1
VRWIREYRISDLPADMAAGLTLGAVLVPSGLAFGALAGLPLAGLYASIFPLLAYALAGGSRMLAVGTDTTMATFVALTLGPLTQGDPARLASLVALFGCALAAIFLIAALLRLGFMADFLSKSVIVGFSHGLAIVILGVQLPRVLGIAPQRGAPVEQLAGAIRHLGDANLISVTIGVLSTAIVLLSQRLGTRVPGQIVVLVGAIAVSYLFDIASQGVAVVGSIPSGLPALAVPLVTWQDASAVAPLALGMALVMFSDTVITARAFAARARETVDANRELYGLSASNIASALTQGLAVSGNGSPTAVAFAAGGRTQATSVFGAVTVVMVLLFLTPYLAKLPTPALGGILIAAAYSLCDFAEFRRLWRFRGTALVTALVVLGGVASLGVMEGIGLGVLISLVLVLKVLAFPTDSVAGHAPGERPVPGVIVYRFSAPLFFANAALFQSRIRALVEKSAEPVSTFVLDASVIFEVDLAACEALNEVAEYLQKRGIRFAIANLSRDVAPTIERGGVTACVGARNFFSSVSAALTSTSGAAAS